MLSRRGPLYVKNRSDRGLNRGTGTTAATGLQLLHEHISTAIQLTQQMAVITHAVTNFSDSRKNLRRLPIRHQTRNAVHQ